MDTFGTIAAVFFAVIGVIVVAAGIGLLSEGETKQPNCKECSYRIVAKRKSDESESDLNGQRKELQMAVEGTNAGAVSAENRKPPPPPPPPPLRMIKEGKELSKKDFKINE